MVLDTNNRKQAWKVIEEEEKERKEKEERKQMSGSEMQWRCQCGKDIPYMQKICRECKMVPNHLNMVAMTKAEWKMWDDDRAAGVGTSMTVLMQKRYGREFLNLGMSCTYSQYENGEER